MYYVRVADTYTYRTYGTFYPIRPLRTIYDVMYKYLDTYSCVLVTVEDRGNLERGRSGKIRRRRRRRRRVFTG